MQVAYINGILNRILLPFRRALLDLSADVSDANSCKSRFLTLLLERLKGSGRVVVFGENVVALRTIAEGLAARFDWELDLDILYIDGKLSQNARRERYESSKEMSSLRLFLNNLPAFEVITF